MLSTFLATALTISGSCATGIVDGAFVQRLALHQAQLTNCLSRFIHYPNGGRVEKLQLNPDFYLKDIDFTCVSPWNDRTGRYRAGTAISRRHIVFSKHHPLRVGARIAFVGEYGDMTHYTIISAKDVGDTDIMIGALDFELTPDIHPAKVLSFAVAERLANEGAVLPVVTFDQHERVFVSEVKCWRHERVKVPQMTNRKLSMSVAQAYYCNMISGDSGNPAFMLYDGKPILLYCVQWGGPGSGPYLHNYIWEVQRVMEDLCPGYKLEFAP